MLLGVQSCRALLEQARLRNPKHEELWLCAVRTEARSGSEKAAEALLAKAMQVSHQHTHTMQACIPAWYQQVCLNTPFCAQVMVLYD